MTKNGEATKTCEADAERTEQWLRSALGLVDGQKAFPWQLELLRGFLRGDKIEALDIPTGLGKTAAMAVWLVARALGAPLPRRLVYVVDRRAVVDQATEVAESLCAWVASEPGVAAALGLVDRSLPISTLRGQHVDNRAWLEDPSSPAIVIGTVDMIGSRLLFSGYGVSPKMRPYHAGLLGADTLVVLDEAHLVPSFEDLLRHIERDASLFGPNEPSLRAQVPPFRLLSLSATGRHTDAAMLTLSDDDRRNPIIKKRLTAKKALRVVDLSKNADGADDGAKSKGPKLTNVLASHAWEVTTHGSARVRCLVFCDARKDAMNVAEELRRRAKLAAVPNRIELFVGARRVKERTQARDDLARLGFLAGTAVSLECSVFLVATSAGEVGVDLDADHMVCDLVAWERMVQRLGRVNRRGDGEAKVVVVVDSELGATTAKVAEKQQCEGDVARRRALRKLLDAVTQDGGSLSPDALLRLRSRQDLAEALRDATTIEPLRPELTRALVDAWSMTSLDEHPGRPEVKPWLRGFLPNDSPHTAVVWRRYLPVRGDGSLDAKAAKRFFEAAPPHTSERLETETSLVVDWVVKRASAVTGAAGAESPKATQVVAVVLGRRGEPKGWRTLSELAEAGNVESEAKQAKAARENLKILLDGATLVIDARLGGLTDGLLDEKASASAEASDDVSRTWLTRPDAAGVSVTGFRVRALSVAEENESVWHTGPKSGWVRRHMFVTHVANGEPSAALVIDGWAGDAAAEEDRAEAGRPQQLDEHQSWTEDCARQIARRLGVETGRANLLALAARLHDEGKRATRWQRAFRAPIEGRPYAKTKGPIDFDLLDGYRHELGSLPYVEAHSDFKALGADDQDFVLHLIAAHHGFARPVIGTGGCDDAPPSIVDKRAQAVALRFARLSKRWGPWGLAWWEALLRSADQMASRRNQRLATGWGE